MTIDIIFASCKTIMMNYILFDDTQRQELFPFTLSRPVCEIRVGILTLKQKWEYHLKTTCSYYTESYLAEKYKICGEMSDKSYIYINGSIFPDTDLLKAIQNLKVNTALVSSSKLLAVNSDKNPQTFNPNEHGLSIQQYAGNVSILQKPWQIFGLNGSQIEADYDLITEGRQSEALDASNTVIGKGRIFIEQGAVVQCSILNTSGGSIYIGKNAEVMEGCMIRGSFALGEHAVLKMGAKIYGPTTIGTESRVGGEVNNCVIFGYSNKAHDGFIGNSVIGEWCNLGADTNNSNLKNNYGKIKIWDIASENWQETGLMFCGLLMGDHSKAGINTMFNTGTVAGFCANVFDGGFPPKYIPSFSWGGQKNAPRFELSKAMEVAARVLERRGITFSEGDKKIFEYPYNRA